MASKDDMLLQVETTWMKYRKFFQLANIDHVKFFKWFTGFMKHDDMRKAYRFVFGKLFKQVMMVQFIWNKYDVNWELQISMMPGHYTVKELKAAISELKKVWVARPKNRRRSE